MDVHLINATPHSVHIQSALPPACVLCVLAVLLYLCLPWILQLIQFLNPNLAIQVLRMICVHLNQAQSNEHWTMTRDSVLTYIVSVDDMLNIIKPFRRICIRGHLVRHLAACQDCLEIYRTTVAVVVNFKRTTLCTTCLKGYIHDM